jgi:hypothetical protein
LRRIVRSSRKWPSATAFSRSWLVAARNPNIHTSVDFAPMRENSPSCRTWSSLAWEAG